jgi:hypothetical protein
MATYFISGKYRNPETFEEIEMNCIIARVTMKPTEHGFIDNARIKMAEFNGFDPNKCFVRCISLLENT